eukprot:11034425-Alexandrium_andersonii.AAC.1
MGSPSQTCAPPLPGLMEAATVRSPGATASYAHTALATMLFHAAGCSITSINHGTGSTCGLGRPATLGERRRRSRRSDWT